MPSSPTPTLHWVLEKEKAIDCIYIPQPSPRRTLVMEMGGKGNVEEIVLATRQSTLTRHGYFKNATTRRLWYFPPWENIPPCWKRGFQGIHLPHHYDRPTELTGYGDRGIKDWIRMFGNASFQGYSLRGIDEILESPGIVRPTQLSGGMKWYAGLQRLRIEAINGTITRTWPMRPLNRSATPDILSPNKIYEAQVIQEYTITVYTENQIGLLNRIAIMFSRRKINIESLNTSPSEVEGIHRFTIVINEFEDVVRKLCRQIEKQVEVLKAYFNTNDELVWQELALYKVPTDEIAEKVKVERLLREYGARAVVIRKDYTVFETTGQREETNRLLEVLEPHGLIEFVRSARVAIIKNSKGFHEKLKEFEALKPGEIVENEFLDKQGRSIFM